MVKHTQTISRILLTNCLSAIDHFMGLENFFFSTNMTTPKKERSINKQMDFDLYLGHKDVVLLLLQSHSNVDHQTKTGCTPLMEATRYVDAFYSSANY